MDTSLGFASATFILSWICTVTGILGLHLAGKKDWRGWALGLAAQPVWATLDVVVHAWPLLISCAIYSAIYARNFLQWRRHEAVVGP